MTYAVIIEGDSTIFRASSIEDMDAAQEQWQRAAATLSDGERK